MGHVLAFHGSLTEAPQVVLHIGHGKVCLVYAADVHADATPGRVLIKLVLHDCLKQESFEAG